MMLNLRKGIFRLSIFISIAIFLFGFFTESYKAGTIVTDSTITLENAISQLASGKCESVKSPNTRSEPSLDNIVSDKNCGALYKVLMNSNMENITLSADVLRKQHDDKFHLYVITKGFENALAYFIAVWILYFIIILLIKVGSWIVDGFKSK